MYDPVYLMGLVLSFFFGDEYSAPMAYLDPGTGAMIISAIVGIFATVLLAIKTFWYKISSLFKGKNRRTDLDIVKKDNADEITKKPG
jgi:uncharacterized membrane protein